MGAVEVTGSVPIYIDELVPRGGFRRHQDGYAFHCLGCASALVEGFNERFVVVRTSPPMLLEKATGELRDIPSARAR